MSPTQAFVPFSTFVPRPQSLAVHNRPPPQRSTLAPRHAPPTACVAPRHVRRAAEIERLTKQLEELRATRARLENGDPPASSGPAPSPPAPAAATAAPAPPPPPPPPLPSTAHASAERPTALGQHSSGSRFLSISSVGSDERMPRVLPLVGHVPGLSAAALREAAGVPARGASEPGSVVVSDVAAIAGPVIAVDSTDALAACGDPVCVSVDAERVSAAKLPVVDGGSVVLIVDRDVADGRLSDKAFYAWDVDGRVEIGWVAAVPEGMRLLGRVVYGIIEVDPELRRKKSAWEEENETYA